MAIKHCNINAYFAVSKSFFVLNKQLIINFSIQNRFSMFGALFKKSSIKKLLKF
ncbi:MAG: hypothetical protein K0Q95_2112 [Bacteroidota bacterium]|jgi:hypothetical protein|nr:hypothetical protein [Bacteroidota bacterium]